MNWVAPLDIESHGTQLAGIIAAKNNNKLFTGSVCPGCRIVPYVGHNAHVSNNRYIYI